MSLTGHVTSKEAIRYTKAAEQKRLAKAAIDLIGRPDEEDAGEDETENKSVQKQGLCFPGGRRNPKKQGKAMRVLAVGAPCQH
jgi:hypothetical protein